MAAVDDHDPQAAMFGRRAQARQCPGGYHASAMSTLAQQLRAASIASTVPSTRRAGRRWRH